MNTGRKISLPRKDLFFSIRNLPCSSVCSSDFMSLFSYNVLSTLSCLHRCRRLFFLKEKNLRHLSKQLRNPFFYRINKGALVSFSGKAEWELQVFHFHIHLFIPDSRADFANRAPERSEKERNKYAHVFGICSKEGVLFHDLRAGLNRWGSTLTIRHIYREYSTLGRISCLPDTPVDRLTGMYFG